LAGLLIAFIFRNRAAEFLEDYLGLVSTLQHVIEKRLLGDLGETAWVSVPIFQKGIESFHQQIGAFAFLVISAFCFLILYIVSSQLIRIFGKVLTRFIHAGYLEKVDRLAGAVLIAIQNLTIIAFSSWLIFIVLSKSADLEIEGAIKAVAYMNQSTLFTGLLRSVTFLAELVRSGV